MKKVNINFENVNLIFPNYNNRSLKKRLLSIFTKYDSGSLNLKGLWDMSFNIKKGDRIGLYGPNGSGKTSLLRTISGIYTPSSGKVEVNGKILSLLNVSMGLDDDANGIENITLKCLLLGLDKKQINKFSPKIIEFSDLGDDIYLPIRLYSDGMKLRLAFSISTILSSDILLLDEWISVGDEKFQKKASLLLDALIKDSSILIIASHQKELLNSLCSRIFILESGKIVKEVTEL